MVFRHLCSTTSRAMCVVLLFFFYLARVRYDLKDLNTFFLFLIFLCKLSEK